MEPVGRMLRALAGVCASVVLVPSSQAAEVGSVPPFATIHLDVAPGNIQAFTSLLDEADERGGRGVGMTVRFVKLQPSDAWSPSFSLCAVSAAPMRSECIRLLVDTDQRVLEVQSTSKAGASDDVASPLELPARLPQDDSVNVSMRVDKDRTLTFAVNGNDVHSLVLDFDAKEYAYACSSLVCDLTLADLLAPKDTRPTTSLSHADIQLLLDGRVALAQGNFDLAIDKFSRFIEVAPFFSVTYPERARAWIGKGQPARALADLDEALKLESDAKVTGPSDNVVRELFFLGSSRPQVEAWRDELRAKLSAVTPALAR